MMELLSIRDALIGKRLTREEIGGPYGSKPEHDVFEITDVSTADNALFLIRGEKDGEKSWERNIVEALVREQMYTILLDNSWERRLHREHRLFPLPPYEKYKVIYRIS